MVPIDGHPGEYQVKWSTAGMAPTPLGCRDEVQLVLKVCLGMGEGFLVNYQKGQILQKSN
jgi:hypothetical protein